MLETPNFLGNLALNLESDNKRLRKKIPKLLAAVCCYSEEGHRQTLQAMNYFKRQKNERIRFQKLLRSLVADSDVAFKINVVIFLNALVSM